MEQFITSYLVIGTLGQTFYRGLAILYRWSYLWLPITLVIMLFRQRMIYIQTKYVKDQGSLLLEIKIPKELVKSPLAMEIVLTSVFQTGSATYIDTYIGGKVRPWFSLEIVSLGGEVHFFIWTWPKFKNLIEAQLYSQYPNIEVYEVPDYTLPVRHDPENSPLWGTYFNLSKPDAYPIKSYIDYGLDREQEEESKIDPITSIIEYMGSIQRGEQLWIQILIQAHKRPGMKEGYLFRQKDFSKVIEDEKKAYIEKALRQPDGSLRLPSKGEGEIIAALERSASKLPFDVAIRGFYLATKEANKISIRVTGLIGAFRQYNSMSLNGFKLGWFTDFDYPWQDFRRIRRSHYERLMLEAYKLRSFFQYPYKYFKNRPFVLTTEELATIFHLPGQVSVTPTFERIVSKKAEPPANLPT
ncbi:hypothetical protein KW783_03780 [Candidatus Parcubacteria bacterium]|nr:hypothetical protein [Candidatus Parcubacteria bacterium]